jgi:2-polyprenyl-3-methyl-5-hydroxy-6-metoxy-1,4-benzoquinol methylase
VHRKYLVTTLRRCCRCELLFRSPTTSAAESSQFYQRAYSAGFTTDPPSPEKLEALKQSRFKNSDKDYSQHLRLLSAIGCSTGDLLLDYGCSWGYGSWQFDQVGYKVTGFEISKPRCRFARSHLSVNSVDSVDAISGPFDIFFSAHVLEHVPCLSDTMAFARKVTKPGGWFIAVTPNGSEAAKAKNQASWTQLWGLVHPNLLDDRFYANVLRTDRYILATSPYDFQRIGEWARSAAPSVLLDLSGDELLVIAKLSKNESGVA